MVDSTNTKPVATMQRITGLILIDEPPLKSYKDNGEARARLLATIERRTKLALIRG